MVNGRTLCVRNAKRITTKIIYVLIKNMRCFGRFKEQAGVHYHIFLTVYFAREIKHVIGKQDSTIKLSPRRNRQFSCKQRMATALYVYIGRKSFVGQNTKANNNISSFMQRIKARKCINRHGIVVITEPDPFAFSFMNTTPASCIDTFILLMKHPDSDIISRIVVIDFSTTIRAAIIYEEQLKISESLS